MRGREKDMGKKTGLLLLLAALLCLALAGAAAGEELPQEAQDITLKEGTDPRIPWVITVYECGCRHTYLGAMAGRYGMVLSPYSLYCPDHGDKYREITFEFGCNEDGEPAVEYSGEFSAEAYETFGNKKIKWENLITYIRFEEPVGDRSGWFECRVFPNRELISISFIKLSALPSAMTFSSIPLFWQCVLLAVRTASSTRFPVLFCAS